MKKIIQNPFVAGLVLAISVVFTDFLQAYVGTHQFDWKALLVAGGIVVVGYVGKFLTGTANTTLAMLGSAVIAIVPMLQAGKVDWTLVAVTFALKIIGLATAGMGVAKSKEE